MQRFARTMWIAAMALTGCLEPNPNADAGDTGTSSASTTASTNTSADTGTDTGTSEPAEFAFAQLAFDAGPGGFMGSLPKPDQPNVVALAIIDDYGPRNADALGYAVSLTDSGGSFDVAVTIDGADNNSSVSGQVIALGFAEPPQTHTIELTAADGCASAVVEGGSDLAIVDAVQAYLPNGGAELSYARTAMSAGGNVTIEYCITAAAAQDATLRVSVIAFAPPAGVEAFAADDTIVDSQAPASVSFPQIDAGAQVLHMLSARGFDEAAASNLGYVIDCNANAAPFACGMDLSGFKAGAQIAVGGLTVAIP